MAKGGVRPNAGRPKGAKNKRKLALEAAVRKGMTPLEYMLKVINNPKADLRRRDTMAAAAAPYIHARLQAQVNPIDPSKPPIQRVEVSFV